MYHLVQGGKVRSQVINVPEGLPELLSDITREVLRCQPTIECLCQFIIDYLQSVINTRDKARIAKSIIDRSLRIVDDVIADLCICNISKEKSDYMCEAMEQCFRRFLGQRRCEKPKNKEIIKFNEFDMIDELVHKCKFTDEELKISKPVIEEAYRKFVNAYMMAKDNADGTDCLYEYLRERETARLDQRLKEESAIKIQSIFRGYLVRKSLFLDEPIKHSTPLASDTELDHNQLEMAALKIQRFFRRHKSVSRSFKVETITMTSSQDACSPASNISLTARPSDHHDMNDESYDAKEEEKQIELSPKSSKDHEELQENINAADEVVTEEDLNNEEKRIKLLQRKI